MSNLMESALVYDSNLDVYRTPIGSAAHTASFHEAHPNADATGVRSVIVAGDNDFSARQCSAVAVVILTGEK
jgi:hypothetical protein